MNLIDFLGMSGQQRRRMLDEYVDDLNLERFVPPQLRPAAEFVGEANPVAAMGNAMQSGGVAFDKDATAEARKRAAVDMGMEMAMSLAPAALVRAGYLAAPAGLTEMFATPTGEVIGPMVRNAASDLQYAGRSLAEGDFGGILDAFRPSRDAQSLSAAKIGIDNPEGEWLANKQLRAEESIAKSSPDNALGKGFVGAITAYTKEPIYLPTNLLRNIKGAMDEQPKAGQYKFDELMESVKKEGFNDDSPILVSVNHRGEPYITEGNNRVAVASAINRPYVAAEVKWWNGGEQVDAQLLTPNYVKYKAEEGLNLKQRSMVGSQYSPSLRAAENLKQNKGTYEQMRNMLLKGGAKENELDFSGLDEQFKGENVTKEQLVNWLRHSDPRLEVHERESFGVTGAEPPSHEEMIERYVDENFEAETEYYLNEYGPERLSEEMRQIEELDEDELIEVANYEGYDEDQLDDFLSDYKGYYIDEMQELFSNEDAALAHVLGGYDSAVQGAEALARDSLDENARYNMDFDELREALGLDDIESFDAYETRYGEQYFPSGASDYRENLYKYVPEDDTFPQQRVAGASHFDDDDDLTQFHTRTGIFNVSGSYPNQRARYVGEIQSDAQQNRNIKDSLLSYSDGIKLRDYDDLTNELMGQSNRFNMASMADERSLDDNIEAIVDTALTNINDGTDDASIEVYEALLKQATLDRHNASLINQGKAPIAQKITELDPEQDKIISLMAKEKMENLNSFHRPDNLRRSLLDNPDILPADNPITEKVLMPDIINRANNKNRSQAFAHTAQKQEQFFIDDNPELENKMFSGVGGPVMGSQNQWLDYALRSELMAAVNDPTVDYLALPFSTEAIGVVGGTRSPKQGTIDFYRRDVQNRMKNILKKNKIEGEMKPIFLDAEIDGVGPREARGLRLTPEMRYQIKKNGLPTFAALAGAPLLGVFDYLKEQKEKRNERVGGILGYQF